MGVELSVLLEAVSRTFFVAGDSPQDLGFLLEGLFFLFGFESLNIHISIFMISYYTYFNKHFFLLVIMTDVCVFCYVVSFCVCGWFDGRSRN